MASSCGTEGTRAPRSQQSALRGQCLEREGLLEERWDYATISAAEELPRVRNTAFVELHCIGIQADRNWAVFEEPLKDGKL